MMIVSEDGNRAVNIGNIGYAHLYDCVVRVVTLYTKEVLEMGKFDTRDEARKYFAELVERVNLGADYRKQVITKTPQEITHEKYHRGAQNDDSK